MTYWVIPEADPQIGASVYDKLFEEFGTEPFSQELGVRAIKRLNPDLTIADCKYILASLVKQGALGVSERGF